jgi:large subunit ribosomal protein L24
MAAKVRRGDTVQVIGGKDSGKQGRVLRVDPKRDRVFVEGLNMVKRHQRPRSLKDTQRGGQVGGVIEKEGPIHISNVMLVDPRDNKPTRVRIERTADGRRERVAVVSGQKLSEASK